MSAISHRPTPLSAVLAVAAAVAGAVLVWPATDIAGAVGAIGALVVAVGVLVGSVGAVTLGALVVFAGVLVAGVFGAGAVPLLGATLGAVLAWDLGEQAINVGEQAGRGAPTMRAELSHAAASLGVGGATAGLAWGIYTVATGGSPSVALAVLLAAAVLLTVALRP